jgi:hypothetical protein
MGVHVADVNAAASFFAMTLLVTIALAANRRHARAPRHPWLRRVWWMSAAAMILAAMWIPGSRMAVLAIIGAACVALMAVGPLRLQRWPRWAIATTAVAAAVMVAMLAIGLDPRASAGRSPAQMLSTRAGFMETGLRMIASAPIFGVGVGRYFEMSGRFMPSSIYWFYFHENAHNNFLQIGGELGLVGLAAFVWVLAVAGIRIVRGVRIDPHDRLLMGALAGLAAFVATWLTSHPMLVAEVAYPFWILLGVALARADGDAQPPLACDPDVAQPSRAREEMQRVTAEYAEIAEKTQSFSLRSRRSRRFVWFSHTLVGPATIGVAIIIIALAVSVPFRARRQMAAIDFGRFDFGFYDWETDAENRFRWTSRRATFFIPAGARELTLPVRAMHIGTHNDPTAVSIDIGGRPFHRLVLTTGDWVDVRLRLPPPAEGHDAQRIDITADPTWSPAVLFGGRSDVRILGVQVAEPKFVF